MLTPEQLQISKIIESFKTDTLLHTVSIISKSNFKYYCNISFVYYANNQKYLGKTSLYNEFIPFRKFDEFPIYYDNNDPYVFKLNNRHIIWPLFPLFAGIALLIGAAFTKIL